MEAREPRLKPLMIHEEIRSLLETPPDGEDAPTIDTIEHTLTAGYARALALEAERWRLQQRLREMTAAVARGETASRLELAAAMRQLKRQEDEIGALRQELGRLQQRHSSVVRATA